VKALSGRQPWWSALLHGKPIENRVAAAPAHQQLRAYREPFLLHASAGVGSLKDFAFACGFIRERLSDSAWQAFRDSLLVHGPDGFRPGPALLLGGVIGRARVVGLITPDGEPHGDEGRDAVARYRPDMRWHMRGQWGHILTDVEPLPFVPCKGALWLFDLPVNVHIEGVQP
jgi:hypothetical protein